MTCQLQQRYEVRRLLPHLPPGSILRTDKQLKKAVERGLDDVAEGGKIQGVRMQQASPGTRSAVPVSGATAQDAHVRSAT